MKFNTKTRYGLRAMVEIAKANENTRVFQKDISESQKISLKYLDQIIQALKSANLITTVKGKKSGYRLTRHASQITVYQVHVAFDSEVAIIECLSQYVQCDFIDFCKTNTFWSGLNSIIKEYLSKITLEDLVNENEHKFSPRLVFN